MSRNLTVVTAFAAGVLMLPLVAWSAQWTDGKPKESSPATVAQGPAPMGQVQAETDLALSAQEQQVSEIASGNGDREFLMVDKALGKIIVFVDGKPVLRSAILTGASSADRFPPAVLKFPDSHKFTTAEKITPAGRFTVRRVSDHELGPSFELIEVHGPDWWLAIHRVWLGIPSEHRRERLESSNPADEHITFGCLNVTAETLDFLLKHLPAKSRTPLYVLPLDVTATSSFFPVHASAALLSGKAM